MTIYEDMQEDPKVVHPRIPRNERALSGAKLVRCHAGAERAFAQTPRLKSPSPGPLWVRRTERAHRALLADVSWVSYIAVERLDVVAVGIEEECRVVPRSVRSVARRPVRAEAGLDACSVEGIYLFP